MLLSQDVTPELSKVLPVSGSECYSSGFVEVCMVNQKPPVCAVCPGNLYFRGSCTRIHPVDVVTHPVIRKPFNRFQVIPNNGLLAVIISTAIAQAQTL